MDYGTILSVSLAVVAGSAVGPRRAWADSPPDGRFVEEWRTFTTADGLPSNHVFCVRVAEGAVWAGTAGGPVFLLRDQLTPTASPWHALRTPNGLAHSATTALAFDPDTGDWWIGSLGGLTHYSAGRSRVYRQIDSGLANDVIYDLAVHRGELWIATARGCSRYRIARDQWEIYDNINSPVNEMWARSVSACGPSIFLGVMGDGLLRFDLATESWTRFADPDGTPGLDLHRNDGLVDDAVTAVACEHESRIWVGTPFGLSLMQGKRWMNYCTQDSPLPSDRITALSVRRGFAWVGTDRGLCATDGQEWWSVRRRPDSPGGLVIQSSPDGRSRTVAIQTTPPYDLINGIDFDEHGVWVATANGLAYGRFGTLGASEETLVRDRREEAFDNRLGPDRSIGFWNIETPYRRYFGKPPARVVPGTAPIAPSPDGKIRIALLVPAEHGRDAERAGEMIQGATLAVDRYNTSRGQGPPVELLVRHDAGPWSAAANQVVSLVAEEGVRALLAPPGGAAAHAALQVAEKLRVPLVITAAGDPRLTEMSSPWVRRVIADDRHQAAALAWHMVNELGLESIAVFRSADRFGRSGASAIRQALYRMGLSLTAELQWNPGGQAFARQLKQIVQTGAQAVVLWGGAQDAAEVTRYISQNELPLRVFGCARLVSPTYLRFAGPTAENVTLVSTWDPHRPDPVLEEFTRAHQARFGRPPGGPAAHAFDGANLLLEAIRGGGTDPFDMRERLADYRAFNGVTGIIEFDAKGNDAGLVYLASVRHGRFVYRPLDLSQTPGQSPQSVIERALDKNRSNRGPQDATSSRRPRSLRIGCFVPLDEEGRRFVRGARLAVLQRARDQVEGTPTISLRVRDARGDWAQSASALLDLAFEDRSIALLARADPDSLTQIAVLAATCERPTLIFPGGIPDMPLPSGEWVVAAKPPKAIPERFFEQFKREYGHDADRTAWIGYFASKRIIQTIQKGARLPKEIQTSLQEPPRP